ncbi:MAG: hypothetical protein KF760_10845 [Candidatus Eremiobacteraeota bacterium]|nr:hypothetical protein [Candidatus Eremiobacteraeota bacterium]MCW5867229.1 hypothetical protein [Candidatus Eremiobacteraeota bacterium]
MIIQAKGCPFHRQPAPTAPKQGEQAPQPPVDSTDPAGLSDKLNNPKAALIPCPWWRTVINNDMVKVDSNGNVSMKDLRHALKATGVTFGLREGAMLGIKRVAAQLAGAPTGGISGFMHAMCIDKINVLDLPKSSLMHTGDSGTLRKGFNQENLDRLLSFSSDGRRVTANDLADANKKQVEADPGESGRKFGIAEYSILLNVFGKKDEDGQKYLTKEDLSRVFKNNQFPENWEKPKVGFFALGKSILGMFERQKQTD